MKINLKPRWEFFYFLAVPIFIACMIISCSSERNEPAKENPENNDVLFTDSISIDGRWVPANFYCDLEMVVTPDDTIPFSDYPGTICCLAGPHTAAPDDTVVFSYHSNLPDSAMEYYWSVPEGSITLISGQKSPEAIVVFGPDFTGGIIHGGAKSPLEDGDTFNYFQCTTSEEISKE